MDISHVPQRAMVVQYGSSLCVLVLQLHRLGLVILVYVAASRRILSPAQPLLDALPVEVLHTMVLCAARGI